MLIKKAENGFMGERTITLDLKELGYSSRVYVCGCVYICVYTYVYVCVSPLNKCLLSPYHIQVPWIFLGTYLIF